MLIRLGKGIKAFRCASEKLGSAFSLVLSFSQCVHQNVGEYTGEGRRVLNDVESVVGKWLRAVWNQLLLPLQRELVSVLASDPEMPLCMSFLRTSLTFSQFPLLTLRPTAFGASCPFSSLRGVESMFIRNIRAWNHPFCAFRGERQGTECKQESPACFLYHI